MPLAVKPSTVSNLLHKHIYEYRAVKGKKISTGLKRQTGLK